ncbi:M14 family zinc carboxypeptidase, partial [Flavobacterium sp. XS1P27]|uniref:M14 family zinc carboxypeptidase n=1 Tax=Flavobacterium sp. XS1P27 TaxID=3401724 RepID=UPI003AAEB258
MKKNYFILLYLIAFISFSSYSQSKNKSFNTKEIQKIKFKYKRVQIDKSLPNVMQKLEEVGVDLTCGVYSTEKYIQIELSDYELQRISEQGIRYTVLINDVTKFYSDRAKKDMPLAQSNLLAEKRRSAAAKSSSVKSVAIGNIGQRDDSAEISWTTPTNFTLPSTFGGCFTYTGMAAELDKMRLLYPNLISVKANASPTNQMTSEGRPVYYVKISDNPDTNETEPQVLYTGMTHSREVSSLMNQIYFMWYVLENYSTDPFLKNLVDNTEMFFIPVVNPDGLTYNETTATNGGGMQRKNRSLNGGGCTGTLEGVDINRNFGYYYGLTASEATKCSDAYRGTAAFSEKETQIIRDFVLSKNIKTALNHHAYANIIPHPINGKATTASGRENEFAKFSHDMSQYNRYLYGPAPGILYAASGDASDWMCGGTNDGTGSVGSGKNILSASPESGSLSEGGFWPTPLIIPTIAKRAMRMNFINAYYAGKYAKFHDLTQSNVSTLNSNLTFGIERLGQTDANFTLTVTPVSSNILSIATPSTLTGMTILQQTNVTAALVLSSTIKANEKIEYKISLSNGDFVLYEANYIKIYNPTVLFNNTDTDLLTKWTSTGTTWVNSSSAYSGTNSITDASAVAYPNGLDESTAAKSKILTTSTGISLAGAQKVLVQFYAKWDIERNYDLVQIQGSKDGGTTWVTLNGTYTKPTATTETNYLYIKSATDAAFQNSGGGSGVVYDGNTMGKWIMEEIVIDAANNPTLVGSTNAKFRFRMKTDSSNLNSGYTTTFDGFSFDNFSVIKQISEPPVANCKDATLSLNSSGSLTVLTTDVNNGSTDDIGITSISVSPNTFNCTDANTTKTVTLTVTDADGQTSTCVANVTINKIAPTFNSVAAICSGGSLSALPTSSLNSITGTWAPALNNTATTTYTFTPTAGQCATSTTLTITVNPNVTPTFNSVAAICSGGSLSALPTTSLNNITGTWAPALNNTATTTYTFTPTAGQCATSTTLTITVNPNVTPTFTAVAPICSGGSLSALPTTSLNSITGTWAPALNNTATTTYTFTPAAGQCATSTTLTITVNPIVTPTFTAVAPICSSGSLSALPTTSNNSITGTWAPALNNTATTTYTFTPTAGQCATTSTLTITVDPNVTPTFNAVAPICAGATLSALPTTSLNSITGSWAPALSNSATT